MSSQILKQSGDMVVFTHDSPIKQGQFLKFGNSIGVVMSIFEQYQLALLLKEQESLLPISQLNEIKPIIKDQICTINDIQEYQEKLHQKKHLIPRSIPQCQILTNNIYVDLFHPITYGQLLVIKDDPQQSILNKLNIFDQIIVYGKQQHMQGVWFKYSDGQGANYFMPRFALQYALEEAKQKKTLLIIDQVYEHMIANQKLQETIQSHLFSQSLKTIYLSDLLKQLSDACGYRNNQSNLTIAILQRESKDDLLSDELDKELESMQSQIPTNTIQQPSPFNLQIQSPLYYYLAEKLYQILSQHNQKKNEYLQKQQLKIHIDPWDFYEYFDSKPIIDLIKLFNSQKHQEHELVILVDFCVKAFKNELICQMKGSPRDILNDVLGFSSQLKEFEEKSFEQFYYEKQQVLEPQEFKQEIIQALGRFYELYMLHLRMTDQLLQYKKDYA